MRRFFYMILICLISNNIFGQLNHRNGYIIKNNNDTLCGVVNYGNESRNAKLCIFKRFELAVTMTYSPDQIKGYGFDEGKYFVSQNIDGKRVFVEYLVVGRASLLVYNGKFYIITNDIPFTELREKQTIINGSERKEFSSYRELLQFAMNDCDAARELIQKSQLKREPLIGLFKNYNACKAVEFLTSKEMKYNSPLMQLSVLPANSISQFGVIGGVNFNTAKFVINNLSYDYLTKAQFGIQHSFSAGLFYNRRISLQKRWLFSVQTEALIFQEYYNSYRTSESLQYSKQSYEEVFIDYRGIEIPVLFRAAPRKKIINPYFEAGATCNYFVSTRNRVIIETLETGYNDIYTVDKEAFSAKPIRFGAIIGMGVEYKLSKVRTVFFEVRGEFGSIRNDVRYIVPLVEKNVQVSFMVGLSL